MSSRSVVTRSSRLVLLKNIAVIFFSLCMRCVFLLQCDMDMRLLFTDRRLRLSHSLTTVYGGYYNKADQSASISGQWMDANEGDLFWE